MANNDEVISMLKKIIKNKGLKYTKQREVIFKTILNSQKHLNADELSEIISKQHPELKIGIATIYRALSLLEKVNLISSIALNDDGKKFEANLKQHHDHIVCMKCNDIVEFVSTEIETAQKKIAEENGFKLLEHTMYLYGVCKDCQ